MESMFILLSKSLSGREDIRYIVREFGIIEPSIKVAGKIPLG